MPTPTFDKEKFAAAATKACCDRLKSCFRSSSRRGIYDIQNLLKEAGDEFDGQFNIAVGLKRYNIRPLRPDNIRLKSQMRSEVWPVICKKLEEIYWELMTRKKQADIRSTTANSILVSALDEAGLTERQIVCQYYKAKVTVTLPSKYKISFNVKYADMGKKEVFAEQLRKLQDFLRSLDDVPFVVKYWK